MPSNLAPFALAAALLAADSLRLPPAHVLVPPDTTGTVVGRLVEEGGRPLAFASLIVLGTRRGAQSDEEGRFHIDRVPLGSYTLRIQQVGFLAMNRPIGVARGTNDLGTITMPGCPPPPHDPLARGEPADLEATIRPVTTRFRVGEKAAFEVRIRNRGRTPTVLVQSVDGSDRGASPVVKIEIEGPAGGYAVDAVAFCGNRNGVSREDFVPLAPGEGFDPYRGGWKGVNLVFGKFRKPGRYTARFVYSTTSRDVRSWSSAPGGPPCAFPDHRVAALAEVPAVELMATTTFHVDR